MDDLLCFDKQKKNLDSEVLKREIELEGDLIQLDVSFYHASQDEEWEHELVSYLEKLATIKHEVESALHTNYDNRGTAKDLIDYYVEEFDKNREGYTPLLEGTNKANSLAERFLEAHKLVRIGFYPGDENYAVWDYMITSLYSCEILVAITDADGEVVKVAWEN